MLQKLLNLGLLEIGDDDSRFEKITAASEAFRAELEANPTRLIPCTIYLLDHELGSEDEIFEELEQLVISHWSTFRNANVDRPIVLLRSVLLSAISALVATDPAYARAVYHVSRSRVQLGQYSFGAEAPLVEELLQRAFDNSEAEAIRKGKLPSIRARKSKKDSSVLSSFSFNSKISKGTFVTPVARAIGPRHPAGEDMEDPNPHDPNQGQPWAKEAVPRLAEALAVAVRKGNAELGKQIVDILKELETHLTLIAESGPMPENQKEGRMRLNVLWWSEASYSPKLKRGYREMDQASAALAAAGDLASLVPAQAPVSVNYLLSETVTRFTGSPEGKESQEELFTILERIKKSTSQISEFFVLEPLPTTEPLTLWEFCRGVVRGDFEPTSGEIKKRTNLDGGLRLSYSQFSSWLFSNIQARRSIEA